MNFGELRTITRTELVSLGLESLAFDPIIDARLNEAYRLMVTESGEVDDIIELDAVANDPDVSYEDWVLKFKHVELDGEPLAIVNPSDVDFMGVTLASRPSLFVIGDQPGVAKVFGSPKANGVVIAKVRRTIKAPMVLDTDTPSDIPSSYHFNLVDWVVGNLLMTDGRDQLRITMMRDRLAKFAAAVESTKSHRERQRAKPIRAVRYGGI